MSLSLVRVAILAMFPSSIFLVLKPVMAASKKSTPLSRACLR
jgi:hypothetical protein